MIRLRMEEWSSDRSDQVVFELFKSLLSGTSYFHAVKRWSLLFPNFFFRPKLEHLDLIDFDWISFKFLDNKNFAIQRCQKKRIDPAEANTESFV